MLTPEQFGKQYDMSPLFEGDRFIFFKTPLREKNPDVNGAVYRKIDGEVWIFSQDITQEIIDFIYERVEQKKQDLITKVISGKVFTSLSDPREIDYPEATDEVGHMWESANVSLGPEISSLYAIRRIKDN